MRWTKKIFLEQYLIIKYISNEGGEILTRIKRGNRPALISKFDELTKTR